MLIKHGQKEIKKYFEDDSLNQSSLKQLKNGINNFLEFKRKGIKKTDSLLLGSLFDFFITNDEKDFNDTFFIDHIDSLTGLIKEVFESILKFSDSINNKESNIDVFFKKNEEKIKEIIDDKKYCQNMSLEVRINRIKNKCKDIFKSEIENKGKQIVPYEIYHKAKNLSEKFKNENDFKKYLEPSIYYKEKYSNNGYIIINMSTDIYFQKPIYFEYLNTKCKALIDILIVNKKNDKISSVEIIDLKTTSENLKDFKKTCYKYGYDLQMAWYNKAVKYFINKKFLQDTKEIDIKSKFIVQPTNNENQRAELFVCSDKFIETGTNGSKNEIGIEGLMEEYVFHKNSNFKNRDMVFEQNKEGVIL
jgi:hypothetical protein